MTPSRFGSTTWLAAFALAAASAGPARAEPAAPAEGSPRWHRYLDNELYELSLDVRARLELADQEGAELSQAWTLRTRAGVGTKPWHGLSAFAELENVAAAGDDLYWDVVSPPNGRTAIADPTGTELNRAWLQYEGEVFVPLRAKAGRQRIVLDDARFVGDVGWRQNEQTFDSALLESSFGLDGLLVSYAYVWDVRRIFGDEGPPATQDYDSRSHFLHARYAKLPGGLSLTAFAYLLDFENSPGNSADSYGLRLEGGRELGRGLRLGYVLSYAWQTDAGDNPVDYSAHYVLAEGALGHGGLGTLKLGYERLGSDDGRARFVTPLATAHKFNGYADVFLNNGGPDGLQDAYLGFVPKLPYGLQGQVTYHHFWSDEGGASLGDELDFVVKRSFGEHVEVLTKGAWFRGTSEGPPDVWRYWLEVTFRY